MPRFTSSSTAGSTDSALHPQPRPRSCHHRAAPQRPSAQPHPAVRRSGRKLLISILPCLHPSACVLSLLAWGPFPRSQLIAAVLLSPQPPHPFPPIPPTPARTPWSLPSPQAAGAAENAPHPISLQSQSPGSAASQGPSPGLSEKLPHSFKTLFDPCCPATPAWVPQRKQGGP